jgi:hypothetical protein
MKQIEINTNVAVLFVLIGWADRYDGTEPIIGGHRYLKNNQRNNTEMTAFVSNSTGYFNCGIDRGEVHEPLLDVVFVARNPKSEKYQIVCVYSKVKAIKDGEWSSVRTKQALLIPPENRPVIQNYPPGRGMRRWANRVESVGKVHRSLYSAYKKLNNVENWDISKLSDEELETSAFEGKIKKLFIIHRKREAKLRAAKIRDTLENNDGNLRCEVPGCGFNFSNVYGEIGERFAIVHHRTPLSDLIPTGQRNSIDDLAVVCANCHAMIHRGGECRPLESLIKKIRDKNCPTKS